MRTLRWAWPVIALVLLAAVPWSLYRFRARRPLPVVVLDKTVPFRTWIEHRSLYWILEHDGVVKPDGSPYLASRDYLGAHPPTRPGDPPQSTDDLGQADVAAARLVYLADTYGVYRDDLASGDRMEAALERSPKIYGGLTRSEAAAADGAVRAGKSLVAEFNTLGSPTEADARRELETTLGVRWTRWIGRYFPRLEDRAEVPAWMRIDYEREWGVPWRFAGPGYVLMQDDVHCEVLRVGVEVERIGLTIERTHPVDPDLGAASDGIPYPYWFDVVTLAGARPLAEFAWHPTEAGRVRLSARRLPDRFPAVTRRARGSGSAWYFAGDFADNPMDASPVPFAGFARLRGWTERLRAAPSETAFYWRFYVPMMRSILHDVERAG